MSDPFVDQLAHLTRTHPIENKWILVPSQEIGWMLAERLVLQGNNWFNLRFTTPLQLALQSAGPVLWERGLTPCPPLLGPATIDALPNHPYTQLMSQPGMAEAIWSTLRKCRLAGVAWDPLNDLYEQHLKNNNWADEAVVFQEDCPGRVGENDLILLYPYLVWPPLIRDFVHCSCDFRPGLRSCWPSEC